MNFALDKHTRVALVVSLLAMLATVLRAAQPTPLPNPAAYGAEIEIRTDIPFGEASHQRLDLYRPAKLASPRVVMCWFGGAFWGSDRVFMANVAAFLAVNGFEAVTPGYFLGEKDGMVAAWRNVVFDGKAVVRFVRANADRLVVDGEKIVALGYSSGAHLAMMIGFTPNLRELDGPGWHRSESARVGAVVSIAGVCDRRGSVGQNPALLGEVFQDKFDLKVATSPIIYVHPKTVPVYILRGEHDGTVEVSSARDLARALTAARVPHELRIVNTDHYPISVEEMQRIADWLDRTL